MEVQTIKKKYLDRDKLFRLLEEKFGDDYEAEEQETRWVLRIPKMLSEACTQSSRLH